MKTISKQAPEEQPTSLAPLPQLPRLEAGAGFDLLAGVIVIDLTTSVAGPYATMLLADLGAVVLKIERPPLGDDTRAWGPPFLDGQSLWFLSVNRNKKSIMLDTGLNQGRTVLKQLIAKGDIVVTNQPPGVQRKLGLDYTSLKAVNNDLIFVSITGFGLTGERADLTCYDLIAEGYSGIMDVTGAADGAPQKVGAPAADMVAGQDAAMAAIGALFNRSRTGKGRLIDVALVESMTRFLCCRIVPYLGSGEVPTRTGGTDSVIAIYQAFETADRPITLGLGNDAIWQRFWKAVGRPGYSNAPELASNSQRRARRVDIVRDIQEILKTNTRAHWLDSFAQFRVPAGPINRLDEVSADPELQARGLFFNLTSGASLVPQVGLGIRVDEKTATPRQPPPRLGEHTAEILTEILGYSVAEIEEFRSVGII